MENIGALLVSLPTGKPTGKLMAAFTSSLTARSKQIANSYYDNSIESINHDQNFVRNPVGYLPDPKNPKKSQNEGFGV